MIKLKDILMYEGTRCWKGYEKKETKMMFGKRYCYNLFTLLDAIETDSNELRNWIKNPASSNWNESGPYFNMEQFEPK